MTREKQILNEAIDYSFIEDNYLKYYDCGDICDDRHFIQKAYMNGAKWADENPNSKIVYTKEELIKMGFAFDLNGNIRTPEECYDSSIKYTEHRKQRYIDKTCEYLYQALNNGDIDVKNMELFIDNFKKAIG